MPNRLGGNDKLNRFVGGNYKPTGLGGEVGGWMGGREGRGCDMTTPPVPPPPPNVTHVTSRNKKRCQSYQITNSNQCMNPSYNAQSINYSDAVFQVAVQ